VNPFYFGSGARRLFGLYMPARAGGAVARGVVLCYPWGREYLRAHRSMRQLASMLSAAGVHVLRFDYFGTGDSAGDMGEADLEGWRGDIGLAIEELRDTTDATKIGLVGLRLGATLAAAVAAKDPKAIDTLVLWDPVASGTEYLRELAPSGDGPEGAVREIRGFPLTARMAGEFGAFDLASIAPRLPARTLVVLSGEGESAAARALPAALTALRVETIESTPTWVEQGALGAGAVPVKLLQRIVEWHS
jgi:pimeloyl-ACP methyl ester carboxylesterase